MSCLNNFLGVPWLSESHWSRLHLGFVTAKFSEWIMQQYHYLFALFWLFDNNVFYRVFHFVKDDIIFTTP